MNYIYGINAVAEALKARGRSFEWVGVLKERHDLRLQRIVEECRRNGVAVRFLDVRNSIVWRGTTRIRALWQLLRPNTITTSMM
jgi:RNA 2'-O-ribose methyltransferase-like protein